MLAPLDIFDPTSYPTRRDEDWKYSDLSRVLREAPTKGARRPPERSAFDLADFAYFPVGETGYDGLAEAVDASGGRLFIDHFDHGNDGFQNAGEIELLRGQKLVVFESYRGEGAYAAHSSLHFELAPRSEVIRVVILDEPDQATSIRQSTVDVAPGSTFKQYVFATGAKFQRFETHVSHQGEGAAVELNGAYLLKDRAHFDLTTRLWHSGRDGTTSQLIKGLVRDTATAVFQGRILVERGADGTDARMRHQALILNDGAHIRAKPELEIYADDVQCAHGNTIGALDEEALFFAMSRGIPEDAARAMLTQAFVMPVADLIEDEVIREKVIEFLNDHTEAFHGL